MSATLLAAAPGGVPEVTPGADLGALLVTALRTLAWPDGAVGLRDGDVLAVSSKIVSKAEGRLVAADDREDAITAETVRVVATRPRRAGGTTRIVENRQGLVMAAAGVDSSNVAEGHVLLLPEDPDASARALRASLRAGLGVMVGVLVTDTMGRPWRTGVADVAIGAAGVGPLDDLRGASDAHGHVLAATVRAVADEIAAAADLVKDKLAGRPVAAVRGLGDLVRPEDGPGARSVLRDAASDMFREGSDEARLAGYRSGFGAGYRAGYAAALAAARVGTPGEAPS